MCDCEDKAHTRKSEDARIGDDLGPEINRLGREALLQRVTSAARKAIGDLPEPHEVAKLRGEARVFVDQFSELITEGLHASKWDDARLALYLRELGWLGLTASAVDAAVAREIDDTGPTGVTKCRNEYDKCLKENDCEYSFFCLCCVPCSIQYAKCVVYKIVQTGGKGAFADGLSIKE